jgi:hypothetical protein
MDLLKMHGCIWLNLLKKSAKLLDPQINLTDWGWALV